MASRSPRGRDRNRERPAGRPGGPRTPRAPRTGAPRGSSSGAGSARGASGSGHQITTRAVLLLSVLLLLIGSYTATFRAWWSARQDITTSQAERTQLKNEIAQLEDQKQRFNDPAYIRQQARERFGWVMPGEVGYRVIGSDGEVRGAVPTLAKPAEAVPEEWYDKLWGSVKTAGTPEADVAPKDTSGNVLKDPR